MVVGEFVEQKDVVIIGGGPGGYNAAIRAAQLGRQVTLIEKESLGGVCLNVGCIPSKIFAHAAKQLANIKKTKTLGIEVSNVTHSFDQLIKHQQRTIDTLKKGVAALCQSNKIEVIYGKANFTAPNKIGVEAGHEFHVYEFANAVIATGSSPIKPDFVNVKHERVLFAEHIYHCSKKPDHLIIYGNDYSALEAAFSYRSLGASVALIFDEKDDFLFDAAINRELKRILKKQKIKLYRSYKIKQLQTFAENVEVVLTKNDSAKTLTGTHIFITTKRKGNSHSLGIERLGMKSMADGFIKVDASMRTSLEHIYAVGDVTSQQSSAVKAIKEGKVAAEVIGGLKSEVDLTLIPTIVRSDPPIATVGLTEQEAIEQGYSVKTSQFGFGANGFAMITQERDGFVKVISEKATDLLLGVHIIGEGAIELIQSGITALEMVARDEDLAFPIYPHPSYNEAMLEAVEGLNKRAIHIAPK